MTDCSRHPSGGDLQQQVRQVIGRRDGNWPSRGHRRDPIQAAWRPARGHCRLPRAAEMAEASVRSRRPVLRMGDRRTVSGWIQEVDRDGLGPVTPLLPRRLSWRDVNFGRSETGGVGRGGGMTSKRLCACEIRCDLYVTYRSEKWSGRLDSNQRPPAPKCHVMRFPAILREHTSVSL